jgi:hypothetical protein
VPSISLCLPLCALSLSALCNNYYETKLEKQIINIFSTNNENENENGATSSLRTDRRSALSVTVQLGSHNLEGEEVFVVVMG